MRVATEEPHESPRGMFEHARTRSFGKKVVTPKNASQRRYMEEIEKHDMMFAVGPGGTGKTYIAVAMAVSALLTKQVNRIILARPAVEAGERLGFLPGTLQQKIDPYMRPLYDALYDMLDADKLERFLEKGIIEVAPLAFMRGRTLNDSFVILDEAQNTTSEQMKMFCGTIWCNRSSAPMRNMTWPILRAPGIREMGKPEFKAGNPRSGKPKNFRKDDSKPPAESTRGTGATRCIPAPRAEGVGARRERRHDLPGERRRDGANERGVSQEERPHRRAVVSRGKVVASGE